MQAHLQLVLGPMFAGKSQYLLGRLRHYADIGKNVIGINSLTDDRHEKFSTHASGGPVLSEKVTWVKTARLADVNITAYAVIGIDEAQFYPDLHDTVKKWLRAGKHLICAGLDGDATQQPIGQVLRLIPLCTGQPIKLAAECMRCNVENGFPSEAWFSVRLPTAPLPTGKFDTGGAEKYEAVCLRHLHQLAVP